MDEVEAALDDINLSRLPEIFKELRATSQLIVITHQKRIDGDCGCTLWRDDERWRDACGFSASMIETNNCVHLAQPRVGWES